MTALERVVRRIRAYDAPRVLVAFSGGVDSSVVMAAAARALGTEAVTAITAVSPSFAAGELETAATVAAGVGVTHRVIETFEVDREAYARNDDQRCFHCKTELYATLGRIATEGAATNAAVLAGANADDVLDVRPGLRAAEQQRVRNPLLEEGIGKDEVRAMARVLGLPNADKPALACLSSRVAHGIRITPDLLDRIDRAEQVVRDLGFDLVRVRHLGVAASVEVAGSKVATLLRHPQWPHAKRSLVELGWSRVTVRLDGYVTGNLNRA